MASRGTFISHNSKVHPTQESDSVLHNPYEDAQSYVPHEHDAANPTYRDDHLYQGYQDEPFNRPRQSGYDMGTASANIAFGRADTTDKKAFDGYTSRMAWTSERVKNTSAAGVRTWRYDHQGNLWFRGSRASCIGRFFCCFIFSFIFILISVMLTLALFIRPPNVLVNRVAPPSNSTVQIVLEGTTPTVQLNLFANISVNNPNYFDVAFGSVDLDITYPINNTNFGGGHASDVVFKSHSYREFIFPLTIKFKPANDPSNQILGDLVKCFSDEGKLTINYKISFGLKVLLTTIHPNLSNQIGFTCPHISDELKALILNLKPPQS